MRNKIKETTQLLLDGKLTKEEADKALLDLFGDSSSFKVVFDGFETQEQAEAFADWYEGEGEQNSEVWLEENSDIKYAHVDLYKYKKQGGFVANENNEIIVPLKLYK